MSHILTEYVSSRNSKLSYCIAGILTRRYFGKIVKKLYIGEIKFDFSCTCTKPYLHLIMDNRAGVQVRKRCERIPHLPDRRDTVVGETLPCVADSCNNSDRFAVAKI